MSPPPLCLPLTKITSRVKKRNYGNDDDDDDGIDDKSGNPSHATSVTFETDTESYTQYFTVKPINPPVKPANTPRKLIRGAKPGWARGWGIDWGLGRKDEDDEVPLKEPITLRDPPAASSPESAHSTVSQPSSPRNSEQSNDPQEEILRVPGPDRSDNLILGNSPRNRLDYGYGLGLPPKDEESVDTPPKMVHIPPATFIDYHGDPYPIRTAPVSLTPRPSPTRSMSQGSTISQHSQQSKDTRASGASQGSKPSNKSQGHGSGNTLISGSVLERRITYQDPIREYVHTYARLVELRKHMTKDNLDYYVVMSEDAHQSEYTADADKRREWITNFTGSAGQAIISKTAAYLITDSRHWHQAEQELDESWTLIRVGMPSGHRNWVDWLSDRVYESRVGVDARMISNETAAQLSALLQAKKSRLVYPSQNLIDLIWGDKPMRSKSKIYIQSIEYTGKDTLKKLMQVRDWIRNVPPSGLVPTSLHPHVGTLVTNLACIAYVLNLGGDDIPFNPIFISYLYIGLDRAILFTELEKVEQPVRSYLQNLGVEIRGYNDVWAFLRTREWGDGKVIISPRTSYAISLTLTYYRYTIAPSVIEEMMSVKNEIEIGGLKRAYLRDGACYVQFLAWLDEKMSKGSQITEWDAACRLTEFRRKAKSYMGLAYENISATGPNAALSHYRALKGSSSIIDKETPYLTDSGGQYRDGACCTTRTVHFGHPTTDQREAFTRVLQGHIAIDSAIFPKDTTGRQLDVLARRNLWQGGMNYIHGTGHGVGSSLKGLHGFSSDVPLTHGHVLTNEPGYYKPDEFGIRIGSVVVVRDVRTRHTDSDSWLAFERLTCVPIQTRMVLEHMLSKEEKDWLNRHNRACLKALESLLRDDKRALNWLRREAERGVGVAPSPASPRGNTDWN